MKSTKIAYLFEYPKFKRAIKNNIKPLIFFFPHYHFGGGERVHLDILRAMEGYEHTTFIIHPSFNDFFKEDFYTATHIIPIYKIASIKYPSYLKTIAREINKLPHPTVFGCNNLFFYKLLPYLKPEVQVIDLTHAFTYEDQKAPEKVSLPLVPRIDKRVVLGHKTLEDYRALYASAGIPEQEIDKIQIIRNTTEIPEAYPQKKENKSLEILFVSRNSKEKRPEIFFKIAEKSFQLGIDARFSVIGDFDETLPHTPNLKIIGSIKDRAVLNTIYKDADLLLITSFREGLPMVCLESMAYGVVNLCTPVGEIPHTFGKGSGAVVIQDKTLPHYLNKVYDEKYAEKWLPKHLLGERLTEEEDQLIDAFIEQIKLFSSNRALLREMSSKAYDFVKEHFSRQTFNRKYSELLAPQV